MRQYRHEHDRLGVPRRVDYMSRCIHADLPWGCPPLCPTPRAMRPSLTRRGQAVVVDVSTWWSRSLCYAVKGRAATRRRVWATWALDR